MTTTQANRQELARIADTRTVIDQARMEGAAARGETGREPWDRILRLASRAAMHRAGGRMQAYAACKRMAQRIVDSISEEA
jgi:hypothetical protein